MHSSLLSSLDIQDKSDNNATIPPQLGSQSPVKSTLVKRKQYSTQQKLFILENLNKGKSISTLSKELNIPCSTLCTIKKQCGKLMTYLENFDVYEGLHRKRMRKMREEKLEAELFRWFLQQRNNNININGYDLTQQAVRIGQELNINFIPSKGFLYRWKRRHGIKMLKQYPDGEIQADMSSLIDSPSQSKPKLPKQRLERSLGIVPGNLFHDSSISKYLDEMSNNPDLFKSSFSLDAKIDSSLINNSKTEFQIKFDYLDQYLQWLKTHSDNTAVVKNFEEILTVTKEVQIKEDIKNQSDII